MKSTGVIRKVDQLGRVVLPKLFRQKLKIEDGDPVEISLEEDKVILQKYQSNACAITGEVKDDNISLLNGNLTLSKDGAKMLIEELTRRI
ncbi:AbrB/MazE/SpoVT family DNA-binding domain-containing protein [Oceanobacillus timonensis]|uniref:AbrB/MazE/SpoVT family DNA-binding domain-containing protein n=1 Tax=Oceanobacillus timonensis TaxID=1926285 RepID=UPI0009BA3149|nr:AbrB/MazE/SpoVT family DNA-binding domain-containing protein [Oceanobacillus timonensis]